LLNLVINAQQAMIDGDGTRVLSIRTCIIGSDAVVDVRDTGPGIPPAIAGKIFEPFFTTKQPLTGTGLGLSLSLGIATAHRGRLELVASDRGSCFRLTLPGAGFPGPVSLPTSTSSRIGGLNVTFFPPPDVVLLCAPRPPTCPFRRALQDLPPPALCAPAAQAAIPR